MSFFSISEIILSIASEKERLSRKCEFSRKKLDFSSNADLEISIPLNIFFISRPNLFAKS